jgi:hypothetical protein
VWGECLDPAGVGAFARDDGDCAPRADGGALTFGDPAVNGKPLAACAKSLAQAGAKAAKGRAQRLHACLTAVFACVQLKPADPACLPKAASTCAKQLGAADTADAALAATVRKRCAVPAIDADALFAATGLGFDAERAACAELGVAPFDSLDAVVACLARRQRCRAEELVGLEIPRAPELLAAVGLDPASAAPCLPATPAGSAAGLGEAAGAKQAVKCQKALAKAALAFAVGRQSAAEKCAVSGYACVLAGATPACLAKTRAVCAGPFAKLAGHDAKLRAALAKACTSLAPAELLGPTGIAFGERGGACGARGVPTLTTTDDVATCLARHHACHVEQILESARPRLRELLELGQISLP